MTGSNDKKGAAQAAPTLSEIGELIREIMDKAKSESDRAALENAFEVGALLLQAKPKVAKGQWGRWVKKNTSLGVSTCRTYMLLARNRSGTSDCVSVSEARDLISGKKSNTTPRKKPNRKATIAGRRLRSLYPQHRATDNELIQARINVLKFVQVLEIIDLPGLGVGEAEQITLADILEELAIAGAWVDGSATVVAAHMGELEIRERIRQLREDTNGRSSFEIETALKIADRLEKKLKPALGAA